MENIRVYSSMTKKKEDLKPQTEGLVRLYACGVTVYDVLHIGHAMQAIFFDVIRRYLEFAGYRVCYVRNYTDVDDKIICRAAEIGCSPRELSEKMIDASCEDLAALGVRPADHEPRVSTHIPEIIALIQQLEDKGYAYAVEGNVYYRVSRKEDYGKLSRRFGGEKRQARNLRGAEGKESPEDFALWKHDTTVDASWDSPWGRGRPGWHIECSALAAKYLGENFEMHGGGLDLTFPHHENEIAQSEAVYGGDYVQLWLHSGLLTIDKQKMSKSLGNFITVKDFLQDWPAEVLRLSILQNHYRSNLDFSWALFRKQRRRLLDYYEIISQAEVHVRGVAGDIKHPAYVAGAKSLSKAMNDDFNTAAVMALIHGHLKDLRQLCAKKSKPESRAEVAALLLLVRRWGEVLGLFQAEAESFIEEVQRSALGELGLELNELNDLLAARETARKNRDWALSDKLRVDLAAKGIAVQDRPSGAVWRLQPEDEA